MPRWQINSRGVQHSFDGPAVMGIVNITPDSFYADSRVDAAAAGATAARMVSEGAAFVDVGAYSSRPGADAVSEDEEMRRLAEALPAVIEAVGGRAMVSVDTFRASVAAMVLGMGADIINDISMCSDPLMPGLLADTGAPYILMHMRGTPQTMTSLCDYGAQGVSAGVIKELSDKLFELEESGVKDIIIDPGFGFAKTLEQNYRMMSELRHFGILHRPLLVGISRKSMITKLLGKSAAEALNASTALNMAALYGGASILRVHDVRPAIETVKIFTAVTRPATI